MCHASPAAQLLNSLVAITFVIFLLWHIYKLDKGRTLVYSHKSAFRWSVIVVWWLLLLAVVLFSISNILQTVVKYQVGYGQYPNPAGEGTIKCQFHGHLCVTYLRSQTDSQWSDHQQELFRVGNHLAAIAWSCLLWINAEEVVFWLYLFNTITRRQSKAWFESWYFKIWVAIGLTTSACMIGITQIEVGDLLKMEHYCYFAGSVFSFLLFVWSLYILLVFPRFIEESRRQGATSDVTSRLLYFKELNGMRTLFRFVFVVALLTLSIDGWTEHAVLNHSTFWLDALFISGHTSVFISAAISMLILLPRNISEEAGITKPHLVYVQQASPPAYRSKSSHSSSPASSIKLPMQRWTQHPYAASPPPDRTSFVDAQTTAPWNTLQERLNIEGTGFESHEMPTHRILASDVELPFSAHPDSIQLHPDDVQSNVTLPSRVVHSYRSPIQFEEDSPRQDLAVVVQCDTIVHTTSA